MYDVFGLGNAIVDTELRVDESFLSDQGIAKGHMTLVDTPRMHDLLAALGDQPRVRSSGGSAANTIVALQSLGYNTDYGCKVADDETGKFFLEHMAECGVDINTSASPIDNHSGQCLILITSDAERTMNTDLGISAALSMDDINFKRFAALGRAASYWCGDHWLSWRAIANRATHQANHHMAGGTAKRALCA